jgi:hypothetical protein
MTSVGHLTTSGSEPAADQSVVLLERARRLRHNAEHLHPLVATAYRRRAAELTVAAWVGAIRAGEEAPPGPEAA